MSKEQDVVDLLLADSVLTSILTGGIYTDETVSLQGFHRGEDSPTNAAFDEDGNLLPCAIVRQESEEPYRGLQMPRDQITPTSQAILIFFYQNRERDQIVLAKKRSYQVLQNKRLGKTYPLIWIGDTPPFFDVGPVANSTTIRQDWRCVFLKRPGE